MNGLIEAGKVLDGWHDQKEESSTDGMTEAVRRKARQTV